MKKKLLMGIMSVMLLAGGGGQAFADSETYKIKEAEMELKIPEEFVVFERIVDEFDPNLELINSTKAELEKVFNEGNIYLNAVMVPPDKEIVVTLNEYIGSQEIFNFKYFSEKEMDTLGKNLIKGTEEGSNGIKYTGYEIYDTSQGDFIVLDSIQSNSEGEVYGKQYYTIVNGQAIYITLHSYNDEVSAEAEAMLKDIVDSIKFKEILEKPQGSLMERIAEKITIKTLAIGGGMVILCGIGLIIYGLKRRNSYDEDEEAFDEYEEDYNASI